MKRLKHWWQWITTHIDSLTAVATVLSILGIVLLVVSFIRNSALLQVLGAAMLGAGLSALVGAATGSAAVRHQSAREANLERKRYTYGPLYAEIKALHTAFSDAKSGAAPAPRWIDTGAGSPFMGLTKMPTMQRWLEFKRDYRDSNFSEAARHKLDYLEGRVVGYNGGTNVARKAAVFWVSRALDTAVEHERTSDAYKHSKQKQIQAAQTDPVPLGHNSKSPDDWYDYLDLMEADAANRSPKETVGEAIAAVWFTNWPVSEEAQTLGWLLGEHPDKAADCVWRKYPKDTMQSPPPPLEFIMDVFLDAWPNIQRDKRFLTAMDGKTALFEQLIDVEKDLETGLREIQMKYEGGKPIV